MASNAAVRRLVLIHSGPYAYASFDLTTPTQVVAENNAGKTSLIATLQYLYVADRRQLKFNESDGPAAAFYFPYPNSCIVFELDTPGGIRCVLVRSTGAAQEHGFERWIFNGTYDPALFFDGDQVRDAGSITAAVASERDAVAVTGANELDDYTRALTGLARNERIPSLGLVPVRQKNQYKRFISSFQGLLNLSRLTQESLKSAAVELAGLEPDIELNIRKLYRDRYDRLIRRWRENSRVRETRTVIESMIADVEARDEALARVPAARAALEQHREAVVGRCDKKIREIDERMRELDSECESMREEENTAKRQRSQYDQTLGKWVGEQQQIEALDEKFRDFDPEFHRAALKETETRYDKAQQRYHQAPSGDDLADLRRQRKAQATEMADLEQRIDAVDDMTVQQLRAYHDDGTLDRAFRLLNPALLTATDTTVAIENREAAARVVTAIDEATANRVYSGQGIRVGLDNLPGPDLENTADPQRLRERHAEIAANIERIDSKVAEAESSDNLRAERDEMYEQFMREHEQMRAWEEYREKAERRPTIDQAIADAQKAIEKADEELDRLQRQIDTNRADRSTAEQQRKEEEGKRKQAIERFEQSTQQAEQAADDWQRPLGADRAADTTPWQSLEDAAAAIHQLITDARARHASASEHRERLADSRHGTPVLSDTDEATQINEARERIATLEQADQALSQEWHHLAIDVAQEAERMIDRVEHVESAVRKLNHRLAGMRISNLEEVSIRIKKWPNTHGGLEALARFADDQSALDLSGNDGPANILEWFEEQMTDRPRFRLIDLFGLEIRTRQQAGSSRGLDAKESTYVDVDDIGSNGTSIMIKIVLQVLLLRGLFRGDAGAARLPFYLDEVASIDESNVSQLLDLAERIGCTPILAAPYPVEGVPRYHHLQRVSEGDAMLDDSDIVDVYTAPELETEAADG